MTALLAGLIVFAVALVVGVALRPSLLATPAGRLLAFVALFLVPGLVTLGATSLHLEHSKRTEFCLSCHEMEAYGQSLGVDDPTSLPAAHYQNGRVPREAACYACHTQYTMYGDLRAKLAGLRHLGVHYFDAERRPGEIRLYEPYQNRECLHCHDAARSFVEGASHGALLAQLRSGELSCLQCHTVVHDVARVAEKPRWQPPEGEGP